MNRFFAFCLIILYLIGMFGLAIIPGSSLHIPGNLSYFAHLVEFVGLSFLCCYLVFLRYEGFYPYMVLSFCFAVGLATELVQVFVPYRTVSFWDLCADMIGGLLGVWVFAVLFEREWVDAIRRSILS